MNLRRFRACTAIAALLFATAAQQTPAWRDTTLGFDQRAADLVSRMTLEEKVGQMQNAAPAIERLGIPAYDWWNEALHGGHLRSPARRFERRHPPDAALRRPEVTSAGTRCRL